MGAESVYSTALVDSARRKRGWKSERGEKKERKRWDEEEKEEKREWKKTERKKVKQEEDVEIWRRLYLILYHVDWFLIEFYLSFFNLLISDSNDPYF